MRKVFMLAAFALLNVFTGVIVARADSLTITFEPPYTPGSIDGQQGWGGTDCGTGPLLILPSIDQEVVSNGFGAPASFGTQSWRLLERLAGRTVRLVALLTLFG